MKLKRNKTKLNLKQKILLILLGLVILPFLLEAGLLTSSFIYYRLATKTGRKTVTNEHDYIRILCLGDSFCFGLGAPFGSGFPEQLQKLLDKNYKGKFVVYNKGIPGRTSSQVLRNLEKNIKEYKPALIALIVGVDDAGHLEDSNYCLFKKTGSIKDLFSKLDIYFSQMRSYKLLKQILLRLRNRIKLIIAKMTEGGILFASEDSLSIASYIQSAEEYRERYELELALVEIRKALQISPNNQQAKAELLNIYLAQRRFEVVIESLKKRLEKDPNNLGDLCQLASVYNRAEEYDLALSVLKKAQDVNPRDAHVHIILGLIYYNQGKNNPALREKSLKLAIGEYKKAIAYSRDDLGYKGAAYSNLADLYWKEGEIDLALETMMKALTCQPENKDFWVNLRTIRSSKFSEEENNIFNLMLSYNLSKICEIARFYKIKLILLGYPSGGGQDEIRKKISDEYEIPFIEFSALFTRLLSEKDYNYKDLFSDDADHCNVNGYRIMAEEIFKVIAYELRL